MSVYPMAKASVTTMTDEASIAGAIATIDRSVAFPAEQVFRSKDPVPDHLQAETYRP
jgi:hypothetical protein